MLKVRVCYENGHLTPLEPIQNLAEGQEVTTMLQSNKPEDADPLAHYIEESRQVWDEEWLNRLTIL